MVKRIEESEQVQGGLYIPDSAKEKPQEGEAAAVGKGKRLEDGKVVPLDVQVGDRILFGKYSGSAIGGRRVADGPQLRAAPLATARALGDLCPFSA